MRNRILVCLSFLLLTSAGLANQTESEPNNTSYSADGPVNFDEVLTGGLPGVYGGDDSPYDDYWSFTGVKGTAYSFIATPINSNFIFPLDIDLAIVRRNVMGEITEAVATAGGDNQTEMLLWSCTSDDTYYLVVYEGTGILNAVSRYEINCTSIFIPTPDLTPPYYFMFVTEGIHTTLRTDGNTAAELTWGIAGDDISADKDIVYNVYADLVEANVFSGSPIQSFSGAAAGLTSGITSGKITSLDPTKDYYFGVRAQDEAGNEETNTRTMICRVDLTPERVEIEELFEVSSELEIDNGFSENETIRNSNTTGFAWGGYSVGAAGADREFDSIVMGVPEPTHGDLLGLAFYNDARVSDSFVYTRFDAESTGANKNVPSQILDLSGGDGRIILKVAFGPGALQTNPSTSMAVMIRDKDKWWQSDGIVLSPHVRTGVYPFGGPDAVSWMWVGSVDIDDVDDGGELQLSEISTGTPDFSNIEGMGIMILSAEGPSNESIRITSMKIGASQSDGRASVRHWHLYERE